MKYTMHPMTNLRIPSVTLLSLMATLGGAVAGDSDGFGWNTPIPDDCPFERSKSLTGVHFTGRHSDYPRQVRISP